MVAVWREKSSRVCIEPEKEGRVKSSGGLEKAHTQVVKKDKKGQPPVRALWSEDNIVPSRKFIIKIFYVLLAFS